jgi:hypothetical protein
VQEVQVAEQTVELGTQAMAQAHQAEAVTEQVDLAGTMDPTQVPVAVAQDGSVAVVVEVM